jgi:hypothetical protein
MGHIVTYNITKHPKHGFNGENSGFIKNIFHKIRIKYARILFINS